MRYQVTKQHNLLQKALNDNLGVPVPKENKQENALIKLFDVVIVWKQNTTKNGVRKSKDMRNWSHKV